MTEIHDNDSTQMDTNDTITQHASTSICHTYTSRGWGSTLVLPFHGLWMPSVPLPNLPSKAIWMSPNASAILSKWNNSKASEMQIEYIVGNKTSLRLAQKLFVIPMKIVACQTSSCCSRIHFHQRKSESPREILLKKQYNALKLQKYQEYPHNLAINRSEVWSEHFVLKPFLGPSYLKRADVHPDLESCDVLSHTRETSPVL